MVNNFPPDGFCEKILPEIKHATKKRIDFWLLPSPKFLQAENFKYLKNKFPQNCMAIASTNKIFISWLKLRLNNVFVGEFSGPTEQIKNPLDFDSI